MESFYRAFHTPQAKILNKNLRPYCLGHLLTLKALDNPFVLPNGEIMPQDLIIALKVCETSYPFQPSLKLTFREKFNLFLMVRNRGMFFKYCQLFQSYLDVHHNCPEYWEDSSGDRRSLNSPIELSYVVNLMKSGISHVESWSMSIGYLSWFNAALHEISGSNTTFTDPLEEYEEIEDLSNLTEQELYRIIVADKGEIRAKKIMEERRKNGR